MFLYILNLVGNKLKTKHLNNLCNFHEAMHQGWVQGQQSNTWPK